MCFSDWSQALTTVLAAVFQEMAYLPAISIISRNREMHLSSLSFISTAYVECTSVKSNERERERLIDR